MLRVQSSLESYKSGHTRISAICSNVASYFSFDLKITLSANQLYLRPTVMGIKYLTTYLENHPNLKHTVRFQRKVNGKKLLIWDACGWLRRCFGAYSRSSKLLFDFKVLDRECKKLLNTFKRFGFEVVAFIDGYFCGDKFEEKRHRKARDLKAIRKNIKILRQMHENKVNKQKINKLQRKMDWIPSSGFKRFLERALMDHGCTVYRGTGLHDIDRDIARFAMEHKEAVYGIISGDTDFFGFIGLPDDLKLITEFNTKLSGKTGDKKQKKQALSFTYFYSLEIWNVLGLQTIDQRFELISLVGNDFTRKRTKTELFRRCRVDEKMTQIVSESVRTSSERTNCREKQENAASDHLPKTAKHVNVSSDCAVCAIESKEDNGLCHSNVLRELHSLITRFSRTVLITDEVTIYLRDFD